MGRSVSAWASLSCSKMIDKPSTIFGYLSRMRKGKRVGKFIAGTARLSLRGNGVCMRKSLILLTIHTVCTNDSHSFDMAAYASGSTRPQRFRIIHGSRCSLSPDIYKFSEHLCMMQGKTPAHRKKKTSWGFGRANRCTTVKGVRTCLL